MVGEFPLYWNVYEDAYRFAVEHCRPEVSKANPMKSFIVEPYIVAGVDPNGLGFWQAECIEDELQHHERVRPLVFKPRWEMQHRCAETDGLLRNGADVVYRR